MEYLNPDVSYGEMLDKRDNQVYRTPMKLRAKITTKLTAGVTTMNLKTAKDLEDSTLGKRQKKFVLKVGIYPPKMNGRNSSQSTLAIL